MKNLFRFLIAQLSFFYKNKKINKKFETKVIKEIESFYEIISKKKAVLLRQLFKYYKILVFY